MPSDSETRMNSSPSARSSDRLPTQRHLEHEARLHDDTDHRNEPDEQIGQDLAEDDLPGAQRRHEERLECAGLLFTSQRNGGHERRDDGQHERHQSGHEEVGAFTRRIETRANLRHDANAARRRTKLALVRLNHLERVCLHRASRVWFGCVGDDLDARWKPLSEPSGEPRLEDEGLLRVTALEQPVDLGWTVHDGDDAKGVGRAEAAAQRECDVVRRRIHDRKTDVLHVGADRVAEDDHLQDRYQRDDDERSAIAQNVIRLFPQKPDKGAGLSAGCHHAPGLWSEGAAVGRARRTNTSSTDSVPNRVFNSDGVPIAPILPATMIEMRSQYSASSM